jgi:uncharacterized protein
MDLTISPGRQLAVCPERRLSATSNRSALVAPAGPATRDRQQAHAGLVSDWLRIPLEACVQWMNEPARWSAAAGSLTVIADGGTDFWRTTHYGFVRDNGHVYGDEVHGDFELSVRVHGAYADQFDQAGAMVRVDEQHWMKTGLEYVDGRTRLSTVITSEYSSWMVADMPAGDDLSLRLARRGDAVEIRYSVDGEASDLAALAYLPPGTTVFAGAMCAAPDGPGFEVSFYDLAITPIASVPT